MNTAGGAIVALCYGAIAESAPPDEQDVLVQVAAAGDALERLGYRVVRVPITLDLASAARTLRGANPALVFNLVESLDGDDHLCHLAAALFEHLKLPYTGATQRALCVTADKILSKQWLTRAGIETPRWLVNPPHPTLSPTFAGERGSYADDPGSKWIIKRRFAEASTGLDDSSVVAESEVVDKLAERYRQAPGEWFAEQFIGGREFNLALIATPAGPCALPVAEIRFEGFPKHKPRIVGYAAKWDPDSFECRHTPRSFAANEHEPELVARLTAIAVQCWELFELDGYARVDIRMNGESPCVLEANANPCLSPDAGFAAALAAGGYTFDEGISLIVGAALRRAAW